jgi:hypothetical protein
MNILEMDGFNVKVSTRSGTYIVWVRRSGETLELEVEEPNGNRARYCYAAGKFISREWTGEERYHPVRSLPWVMVEPVFEVVSREIQQVGTEAVEAYLQYEREAQVNQG